ncbi:MAG: hypothetical protein ACRBBP_01785 [Bdellovibrionales bacterium]
MKSRTCSDYIEHLYTAAKDKEKDLSVRAFSKKIGFLGHSLVFDVLNRKKKPSPNLVACLFESLDLHYSEERYLHNLVDIEKEQRVERALEENALIEDYWVLDIVENKNEGYNTFDTMVKGFIEYNGGGLTENEIFQKSTFFVSKDEILESLKKLMSGGILSLKGDRYIVADDKQHLFLNMKGEQVAKIQNVISAVSVLEWKEKQLASINFFADEETYLEVRKLLYNTCEKIALLAQKNEDNKKDLKHRKQCVFYTSFFSLDSRDSW